MEVISKVVGAGRLQQRPTMIRVKCSVEFSVADLNCNVQPSAILCAEAEKKKLVPSWTLEKASQAKERFVPCKSDTPHPFNHLS